MVASCATSEMSGGLRRPELVELRALLDSLKRPTRRFPWRRDPARASAVSAGSSRAGGRGPLQRTDARGTSATADLLGPARRQSAAPGRVASTRGETIRVGQARAAAVNLDKVYWPDKGSPRATWSTTTGRWRRCSCLTCAGAVHDAPVPRRIAGKAFFQKDAPVHMPGLDQDLPRGRAHTHA